MLQYEADGCFVVRAHPGASPQTPEPTATHPVCELIYVFQGRPLSREIDITKRGVRFRGSYAYFESLSVLVLSYRTSAGEELRCQLTQPPGHAHVMADSGTVDLSALDAFAFDARVKQQRRRSRKVCEAEWS